MTEQVEWRWQLGLGLICVGQSFISWDTPAGPWESPSFSSGVIALVGLGLLYIAKYRWQFEKNGLIPYLNIYSCEREKIALVSLAEGMAAIVIMQIFNYLPENGFSVPVPAPLILLLYASLMFLHAIYAWLVISGPLSETE